MRLSSSPTSRASYFLLFHAWQHLCDWRDWPLRVRQLRTAAYASLEDTGLKSKRKQQAAAKLAYVKMMEDLGKFESTL